jgi:hypothetical protein
MGYLLQILFGEGFRPYWYAAFKGGTQEKSFRGDMKIKQRGQVISRS